MAIVRSYSLVPFFLQVSVEDAGLQHCCTVALLEIALLGVSGPQ